MAFFKRNKKGKPAGGDESDADGLDRESLVTDPDETSSQRVGIVSGVLSTQVGAEGETPFGDVVARRFGPSDSDDAESSGLPRRYAPPNDEGVAVDPATSRDAPSTEPVAPRRLDHLRAVEPLFSDHPATPELEVDPMAHVGRATTITGDIVAEEDLEIQGTIEGSVQLKNHQLTIGNEGHVKASVDANIVIVYGKITGNVVASDLVEIEKGGIVGGDIKAPRIIMHDGAIVVGGLDMSASLPNSTTLYHASDFLDEASERPLLQSVEHSYDVDSEVEPI